MTVLNWEKGKTEPLVEHVPAILNFLRYDPFDEPNTIPERLLAKRRAMGWSVKEAARQLGVDEGSWGAWESGGVVLFRRHRELVAELIGVPAEKLHREMRHQWNRLHSKMPMGKT